MELRACYIYNKVDVHERLGQLSISNLELMVEIMQQND